MKCAKIRALCITLVIAAPLFIAACSSSTGGDAPLEQDTTPPTIIAQFPANGATAIPRSGPFWVAFSEPMNTDMFPTGISISPGPVYNNTSWNGDTLVVTPSALLNGGASYSITIAGTCEDAQGNPLGSNCEIPFTTTSEAEVTPPAVVSTDPADGSTEVLGTQVIEITFNEPMNTGSAQDAVQCIPEPADGWSEWNGLTLTLHHSAFPQNSLVTITVSAEACDLSDNPLGEDYTFSFQTREDDTRPYLASAAPSNGATGVATSLPSIVFNFSEPMDMESFNMDAERVDARINQTVREEPTTNADGSSLTVPVTNGLLPGCTYWVSFGGVTDAADNPIDPNPTPYQFTTAGTATSYPVKNGDTWHYARPGDDDVTRSITGYNQGTGAFDELLGRGDGSTQEIVHLKKTSTQIQHLGRDEYHDGSYAFSMIWDSPLPYIKLPVENYLGQSWSFSTTSTIDDSTTMTLSGHMEVEASTIDLVSDALRGTFKGCAVHHLYGDYTMYVHGNPVDEGHVHQILWLAPGVGPVQIVNADDGGGSDTLRVYDWSL